MLGRQEGWGRAVELSEALACAAAIWLTLCCDSGCTKSGRSPSEPTSRPVVSAAHLFDADRATTRTGTRHRWSFLLKHVFRADVEHCPRCGGPMRWVEAATAEAVERLLVKHGLTPRAPPVPAVPLGQLELSFVG
jgi:hypothetical protein